MSMCDIVEENALLRHAYKKDILPIGSTLWAAGRKKSLYWDITIREMRWRYRIVLVCFIDGSTAVFAMHLLVLLFRRASLAMDSV